MCEEAFDERTIGQPDRVRVVVRGGYGRKEVYIGVCPPNGDEPLLIATLDECDLADLHETIRLMMLSGGSKALRLRAQFKKFRRSTR